MSQLYISDVFKIFLNYEPSRLKVWEIVRTYDVVSFAKFLYLLENVSKSSKRSPTSLNDSDLREFCNYNLPSKECNTAYDIRLCLNNTPSIRLERVENEYENSMVLFNKLNDDDNRQKKHPQDVTIDIIMNNIRLGLNDMETSHLKNIYERIIQHNLGTHYYGSFVTALQYLLFTDNLQIDRNDVETTSLRNSIVSKYLQMYKMFEFEECNSYDPRNCRFIILQRPERFKDRNIINKNDYIIQPLYQGFHLIVYTNKHETRCYNRFGELQPNILYGIRLEVNCTFEAIVLPVDKYGVIRSWRYWPHKHSYILYITDVIRYEHTLLMETPFEERLKYTKLINNPLIYNVPDDLFNNWDAIETRYIDNRDVYDPIVGVILKRPQSKITERPLEYRFNILYCYNMLSSSVLSLRDVNIKDLNPSELHISFEMADYWTTCIVYGHNDYEFYICEYDRNLHQFVHVATLDRLPYDSEEPSYKSENIYVINNRILPKGVFYLRVYYDLSYNLVGYDTKHTDSKFNVPYENLLLKKLKR